MILLVIPVLIFLSVFLLVYHLWPQAGEALVEQRLRGEVVTPQKKGESKYVKRLGDYLTQFEWPILGRMTKEIKKQLVMSGAPKKARPIDFIAQKVLFAIILAFVAPFFFNTTNPLIMIALAAVGFSLPSFQLKGKVEKRHKVILRSLPDTLDLLTLCVEAGLDFGSAVNKVIEKGEPGPLTDELFLMTQEMRMGKSRVAALQAIAERVNQPDLASVISALVLAEQMGTTLGPVIRLQAEDMRIKRFQLAEKLAAAAPTKMLFPLVIFIFPTIFIIIFGPFALGFLTGGGVF